MQFGWQVYHVPSLSMRPALQQGDLLFVNKHSYNLVFPFSRQVIMSTGRPGFGDIVIFEQQQKTYVKRIIGLSHDHIRLQDNQWFINGQPLKHKVQQQLTQWHFLPHKAGHDLPPAVDALQKPHVSEELLRKVEGGVEVAMSISLIEEGRGNTHYLVWINQDATAQATQTWQVPEDSYFVLGDNRHESTDSRHFGVIHHSSLTGQLVRLLN